MNLRDSENNTNAEDDEGDVGSTRQTQIVQGSANIRESVHSLDSMSQASINSSRLNPYPIIDKELKRNWLKVSFNGVTKRINKGTKDLDELKIILWNRFGALYKRIEDPGALKIHAQLPKIASN